MSFLFLEKGNCEQIQNHQEHIVEEAHLGQWAWPLILIYIIIIPLSSAASPPVDPALDADEKQYDQQHAEDSYQPERSDNTPQN